MVSPAIPGRRYLLHAIKPPHIQQYEWYLGSPFMLQVRVPGPVRPFPSTEMPNSSGKVSAKKKKLAAIQERYGYRDLESVELPCPHYACVERGCDRQGIPHCRRGCGRRTSTRREVLCSPPCWGPMVGQRVRRPPSSATVPARGAGGAQLSGDTIPAVGLR